VHEKLLETSCIQNVVLKKWQQNSSRTAANRTIANWTNTN